jgi:hypothetical protein
MECAVFPDASLHPLAGDMTHILPNKKAAAHLTYAAAHRLRSAPALLGDAAGKHRLKQFTVHHVHVTVFIDVGVYAVGKNITGARTGQAIREFRQVAQVDFRVAVDVAPSNSIHITVLHYRRLSWKIGKFVAAAYR